MRIVFTPSAEQELASELSSAGHRLKLVYDSEGCGCAVSGVPVLQLIVEPAADDIRAESNRFELWYERRHEVFFEDKLTIDYQPERHAYSLKSDNQIYTSHMHLVRQRANKEES